MTTTPPDLKFTEDQDWVTNNCPNWEKFLAPFTDKPDIEALEIGTWEGRSAHWFLENVVTDKSASLTTVDQTMKRTGKNRELMENHYGDRVKFVEGDALKFLCEAHRVGKRYHFAYLDGPKDAHKLWTVIGLAWELLKPGGVMIFDDYQWPGQLDFPQGSPPRYYSNPPRVAICAFLQAYYDRLQILNQGWQMIVEKKA